MYWDTPCARSLENPLCLDMFFSWKKTKHLWQQKSQRSRILTAQAMIGTDAAGGESPKASIHDAELAFFGL